jgi:predicted DCC family thiol-disulfide oxidoreductase YuxK
MTTNSVLIYDGDCKFCQLSLEFGIRHMKIFPSYVAFQRIDPADFGLTETQVRSEIWLVETSPQGLTRHGGHLAASKILGMQTNVIYRLAGFLMKTWPTAWLAKHAYRWVAQNRHRLPGGTKACGIQDNYIPGS